MGLSQETSNIARMSASFMILFTAMLTLEVITEPLIESYHKLGYSVSASDGYGALSAVYFANTISSIFAPPLIAIITGKWSMVLGMCTTLIFEANFLYLNGWRLIICSFVMGVGVTFLWVGQGQYVTDNTTDKNMEKNTSFQWAFFKMSLIFGGVFFYLFFVNSHIEDAVKNGSIKIIVFVFMACTLIALLNTCFLPQPIHIRKRESFSTEAFRCFQLLKTRRMLLLAVFFFYSGLIRSFWISIYPSSIKFSKQLGENTTKMLALAMICTGVGQVGASLLMALFGKRARAVGKDVIVCFALLIHIAVIILIYMCFANESPAKVTNGVGPVFKPTPIIALACSMLLGAGDAILQTQVYAFIADWYKAESSQAFSLFRFFSGIASTIIFFLARNVFLLTHLILLTLFAVLTAISVVIFQRLLPARGVPDKPIAIVVN